MRRIATDVEVALLLQEVVDELCVLLQQVLDIDFLIRLAGEGVENGELVAEGGFECLDWRMCYFFAPREGGKEDKGEKERLVHTSHSSL